MVLSTAFNRSDITEEDVDRFWRFVDKTSAPGCWVWTGSKSRKVGYLRIKGKLKSAGSIAFVLFRQDLADKQTTVQICTTPKCCHPDHAKLVDLGSTGIRDRLMKSISVDDKTGCWNWQRGCNRRYGAIKIHGKTRRAHRVSYEVFKGEIPEDLQVCHSCDNPICINPEHLWLGTGKDNYVDMVRKGRRNLPVGDRVKGAKLDPDKVRLIRRLSAQGVYQSAIAELVGVNQASVSRVVLGKCWHHVAD